MAPRRVRPQDREAQIERIRETVESFLNENWSKYNVPQNFITTPDSKAHIINIGTSILCTKWEVPPFGGSFVRAVANNDLMGAYSNADTINTRCIQFYCALIYNVNYVE